LLRLWEKNGLVPTGPDGLSLDEAVDGILADGVVSLIAETDAGIVAAISGAVIGTVGVILRITATADEAAAEEQLLGELEARLVEGGARRLSLRTSSDDTAVDRLASRGYEPAPGAVVLERTLPRTLAGHGALAALGGTMIDQTLWESLKGMEEAKDLIERRVILPLAEPALARRHAVALPKAIVLFGPPGTGKTTFAKGIASRLQWPFVEIQPAELVADGEQGQSKRLADVYTKVLELAAAVVFVDEVEDLASARQEERRMGSAVTNEFLKQLPLFQNTEHHLLVCATNWIGRLDRAFIRPGRFDAIIPVGPPDAEARHAVWGRYVGEITDEPIDVDALVAASEWFTPADIQDAAHRAAQIAFEREHSRRGEHRAVTDDFLAAINATKPSLDDQMIGTFQEDAAAFARL
jgi:hypothetical protein